MPLELFAAAECKSSGAAVSYGRLWRGLILVLAAASSQIALSPFRLGQAQICSFALEQAFAVLGRSRTSRVPLQPVEQEANATRE